MTGADSNAGGNHCNSDTEQSFREWLEEKMESAKDQYHSDDGGEFLSEEFHHGKYTAYQEVLKRYEDTGSDQGE